MWYTAMGVCDINDLSAYRRRYDYTAYLSRRDWAYEYLRRIPEFETQAWRAQSQAPSGRIACHRVSILKMLKPQPRAEVWGLKFFPNPSVPAPNADVFWTEDVCGEIVRLAVLPREIDEVDTLFEQTVRTCEITHLTDPEGFEHLVVKGAGRSVQARCIGPSLLRTRAVKVSFDLEGLDDMAHHVSVLERSKRVYRDDVDCSPPFTRKSLLMRNGLIALDGVLAGLSDRQIAWIIEGKDAVEAGLAKGDRSRVRRVTTYRQSGRALCDGGYRKLLAPSQ